MEKENNHPYLLFTAIIISGILIAGAIIYKNGGSGAEGVNSARENIFNKSGEGENANNETNRKATPEGEGDDPVLGNPEAPLTMVIFGDFQCHFCRKLELEIRPLIVEKYVKTGKLKIIARDFPFLGKNSILAAQAANCAFEQNKYWEYSDILHKKQNENAIELSKENLKFAAKEIGLTEKDFNECLNSDKYLSEVKNDFEDGKALGVSGTPTSFINEEVVPGAQPYAEFEKIIEALL